MKTRFACLFGLVLGFAALCANAEPAPQQGWLERLFHIGRKETKVNDVLVPVATLKEKYDVDVRYVAFSADNSLIATGVIDKQIAVWDWRAGRIIRTLEFPWHHGSKPMQFSPDGRFLVLCHNRADDNNIIDVLDTHTWRVIHQIFDRSIGGGCDAIRFSPDSKLLVRLSDRSIVAAGDTFFVYETATWKTLSTLRTPPFYAYHVALSADGKRVALGGRVINPKKWSDGREVTTYGDPPLPDAFFIFIVNIASGKIEKRIQTVALVDNLTARMEWSFDVRHLLVAGGNGLWSIDTDAGITEVLVSPTTGSVQSALVITPDGRYVIDGASHRHSDGFARVWSAVDRKLVQKIQENVASAAVSVDGKFVATGMTGKTIVWQVK